VLVLELEPVLELELAMNHHLRRHKQLELLLIKKQ
jgi:hypothetical protein